MNVLIATVQVPFVRGGAEILAENLLRSVREFGHQVEMVNIPFKWYPCERIIDHMMACRLLDLTESNGVVVDRVIALKFPAYLIEHPHLTTWLIHQHRSAYDLWGQRLGGMHNEARSNLVRHSIRAADNFALGRLSQHKRLYTLSEVVSDRLAMFNQIVAPPLYCPPDDAHRITTEGYEPFLFFPSRINGSKRQALAVRALRYCRTPIKLTLMGRSDNAAADIELEHAMDEPGVRDRVTLLGHASDDEKRECLARCLAVVFPPVDEDYGYVTLEGMLARKAVITCHDSGGPLAFIKDGETGLVCDPTPQSLADAYDRLYDDRALAERLGQAARDRYDSLDMSWAHVVEQLTSC